MRIVQSTPIQNGGMMVTGGSWSVWMTFPVFSRAGAAGRIALDGSRAQSFSGVPADQCAARNGAVAAGGQSISYGEIVSARQTASRSLPRMNWRGCRSSPPPSAV